jgi:cystathionine beta-lyase
MNGIREFDFDTVLNRKGTNSFKWDNKEVLDGELLPLSVADMDFSVASEVTQALIHRTETPVYGYEFQPDALKEAIIAWAEKRYGFTINIDWLLFTPGVVNGLALSILSFTNRGDQVVIQPPVYPPFFSVVEKNERRLLLNPLHYDSESLHYTMDLDSLEKLFAEQKPKMMFLCNPHNPVGRVWTREELQRLGELCEAHGVMLVSDDIHADLVFPGHPYTPIISISETHRNNVIQLMSPGKSFNIPGLRFSYAVVADGNLKDRLSKKLSALSLTNTNIMAAVAAQSVYQNGVKWLDSVLDYIWDNFAFLRDTLSSKLPSAKVIPLEGTFLAWIDLRDSGFSHDQLCQVVRSKAKLMLFEGHAFGDVGKGFMRINLACPRKTLSDALDRLIDALTQAKESPPVLGIMDKLPEPGKCCSE